jgi:hypothetical protein
LNCVVISPHYENGTNDRNNDGSLVRRKEGMAKRNESKPRTDDSQEWMIAKMDAHQERMDSQLEKMEACLEKEEFTDLEANAEETVSEAEHEEVPKEEAAVKHLEH